MSKEKMTVETAQRVMSAFCQKYNVEGMYEEFAGMLYDLHRATEAGLVLCESEMDDITKDAQTHIAKWAMYLADLEMISDPYFRELRGWDNDEYFAQFVREGIE